MAALISNSYKIVCKSFDFTCINTGLSYLFRQYVQNFDIIKSLFLDFYFHKSGVKSYCYKFIIAKKTADDYYFAALKTCQKGCDNMDEIKDLVAALTSKDTDHAYACLKELQALSLSSPMVYSYFDTFSEMLQSPDSYVRSRAIILISQNAQWDEDNKIDEIIDEYLSHILDEKPITSRQCIKALPNIAKYKPDLKEDIEDALHRADPSIYKPTMSPLVQKDIVACLAEINSL